jgi:hypothetical protein
MNKNEKIKNVSWISNFPVKSGILVSTNFRLIFFLFNPFLFIFTPISFIFKLLSPKLSFCWALFFFFCFSPFNRPPFYTFSIIYYFLTFFRQTTNFLCHFNTHASSWSRALFKKNLFLTKSHIIMERKPMRCGAANGQGAGVVAWDADRRRFPSQGQS